MPLFEVAILEVSKKKEMKEDGEEYTTTERLVLSPKAVLGKDSQAAAISAVLDNQEDLKGINREKMVVLVRPFV